MFEGRATGLQVSLGETRGGGKVSPGHDGLGEWGSLGRCQLIITASVFVSQSPLGPVKRQPNPPPGQITRSVLCLCSYSIWFSYLVCMCLVIQSCLTLCNPMDCSPPGSSVHGILQVRILEWVAMPSYKGSSQPRDWTQVSYIAGRFFTSWATREASSLIQPLKLCTSHLILIFHYYLKQFFGLTMTFRILAPQPGVEPVPRWSLGILTAGLPQECLIWSLNTSPYLYFFWFFKYVTYLSFTFL